MQRNGRLPPTAPALRPLVGEEQVVSHSAGSQEGGFNAENFWVKPVVTVMAICTCIDEIRRGSGRACEDWEISWRSGEAGN